MNASLVALVRRWPLALGLVLAAVILPGRAPAGPAPLLTPPASNLPVRPVYVFGKDDRIALPQELEALKYKIGLIYSANTKHGCTATCVARDVILTAAHCVLSRSSRKRGVETSGFKFVLPGKYLKGEYIIADVLNPDDYTPRNVVSGFPVTRAQAGGGKSKDWALVKLASKACRYGSLPLRSFSRKQFRAASKAGKLMEIAFHGDRDYGKTLLYTNKCRLLRLGKSKRGRPAPSLIRHQCDLTSGASGSPLLIDTADGPFIAAVNVAEFATQRYLRRGRKVIKYYKKVPAYNLAIHASVFEDRLKQIAPLKVVSMKSALERIQTGLKARGLYRGKIDGVFGPATWSALRTFERRQKRLPLGLPTSRLLRELDRKPPES
ncbi:MAG: trypsin-like peptidase domain-containing protein [Pseudomonadota bacterium]